LLEFVPPPSIEEVLLLASGIVSDGGCSRMWVAGGIMVSIPMSLVLDVRGGVFLNLLFL